jgi:serine/threonine-protein kinase
MPPADFRTSDWTGRLQTALGSRYTIERQLTGGGMSAVFLEREVEFDRSVVIKLLPRELADADAAERFRREIALVAHLQHPEIVPLLAAGECEGLPWFAMPYVDGESLSQRLRRGPLSIRESVSILIDVCRALSLAHEHGVVHRDIKPANILFAKTSAVVSDFGVAKAVASARHRLPVTAPTGQAARRSKGCRWGRPRTWRPSRWSGIPVRTLVPTCTHWARSGMRCSLDLPRLRVARSTNCWLRN